MRKFGSKLRRWGRQRVFWTMGLLSVSALAILSFQNCSQPVMTDSEEDQLASEAEKIAFAYDTSFDEIAYMSCNNMTAGSYNKDTYFTFRAGGYKYGGVTLTDSFFADMAKMKPEKMAALLSRSPANTATVPQIALRSLGNYQSIMTTSGSAQEGLDYSNMLAELGTEEMSTLLVNLSSGQRLRYVRDGSPWGARMEASLHFTSNYALAEGVRQYLLNEGLLGLTYTHAVDASASAPTLARSPSDVYEDGSDFKKSVFGRGFKFRFGQPSVTSLYSQFPQVVMKELTEVNMVNASIRTGLGTWSCPSGMQLRIVRPTDLAKTGANCRKLPDPATLSQDLQIIRNVLKPEDWYVDLENRCIIPKKPGTDCYGDFTDVVYNLGESCNVNADHTCTSYASVCYRTN